MRGEERREPPAQIGLQHLGGGLSDAAAGSARLARAKTAESGNAGGLIRRFSPWRYEATCKRTRHAASDRAGALQGLSAFTTESSAALQMGSRETFRLERASASARRGLTDVAWCVALSYVLRSGQCLARVRAVSRRSEGKGEPLICFQALSSSSQGCCGGLIVTGFPTSVCPSSSLCRKERGKTYPQKLSRKRKGLGPRPKSFGYAL